MLNLFRSKKLPKWIDTIGDSYHNEIARRIAEKEARVNKLIGEFNELKTIIEFNRRELDELRLVERLIATHRRS